jgi:lipid A disaccharide synthetase
MRKLKALHPEKNYSFVGVGGVEMQKEGFKALASSDKLLYKPFMPWKNFKWILLYL